MIDQIKVIILSIIEFFTKLFWLSRKKYNWVEDKPDPRDYIYVPMRFDIPSKVDLRKFSSSIEDQGIIGSCTGHAISSAIELVNKKNNNDFEISRLFIYYQERVFTDSVNQDSGAYIRDGIKAVATYGAPLEDFWPYDVTKFTVKPSDEAYADAAKRKVTKYEKCISIDSVKGALANGYPVIIGFYVYSSFEDGDVAKTGIMTYPDTATEVKKGGHAVLLVGYDDNFNSTEKGYFIVKNSWGTYWGDRGYFYMPYEVIADTNMSSDFWLISKVTNP